MQRVTQVQLFQVDLRLNVTGMTNTNLCSVSTPVASAGVLTVRDKKSQVPEAEERDSAIQQVSCDT